MSENTLRETLRQAIHAAYRHGYGKGALAEAAKEQWGPNTAANEYVESPPYGVTEALEAVSEMERDREAMEKLRSEQGGKWTYDPKAEEGYALIGHWGYVGHAITAYDDPADAILGTQEQTNDE